MKSLRHNKGYTLIELLVALIISGILTTAAYSFYVRMHNQTLTQQEISDMQTISRNSIQELTQTLRKAGFKLSGHAPYHFSNDTLWVFFSETQPVDTVIYYLSDYTEPELLHISHLDDGHLPKKLMRKVNSGTPAVYADLISSISYSAPTATSVEVTLVTQVSEADEDFTQNAGVRTNVVTERVTLRNVY